MNRLRSLVFIAAMLATAAPLPAQQKRASPHETVSTVVSGARVTITYGRPYSKKAGTEEVRKIWGGLVPYGKAWRMGADEATTLVTQKAIDLGGTTLQPGSYTLYFVPDENGPSKLAISSAVGGWGIPVNEEHDLARVEVKKEATDKPVDQFTIQLDRSGVIKWSWENTQYSIAFKPVN